MKKIMVIYISLINLSFGSLGFEGEYKDNLSIYENIIKENIGAEYLNNNLRIEVKLSESLNVIVNKQDVDKDIYLKNKNLQRLVQINGSAAKNTSLKIKEDTKNKVIASCDNSKW
ncbi:MAG: hypothetical protein ACRC0V_04010 [Fusobacteriaceae bacterium]